MSSTKVFVLGIGGEPHAVGRILLSRLAAHGCCRCAAFVHAGDLEPEVRRMAAAARGLLVLGPAPQSAEPGSVHVLWGSHSKPENPCAQALAELAGGRPAAAVLVAAGPPGAPGHAIGSAEKTARIVLDQLCRMTGCPGRGRCPEQPAPVLTAVQ